MLLLDFSILPSPYCFVQLAYVGMHVQMVCDDPPKANAGASAPPPVTRTAVVARPRKPAAPNKPPNEKPSSPRPPLYPQKANAIKSVGNGSSSNQPRLFFNVTGERGKNGGGGSPNTPAAAVGYLPPVGMFIHIPKVTSLQEVCYRSFIALPVHIFSLVGFVRLFRVF